MCAYWDGKQCLSWRFSFSSQKKFIFHFPNAKNGFFVKHLPRNHSKIGPPKFSRILDHIVCTNHQLVASQKISRYLSPKRQITVDSAGSGSNFNYRCLILCSWFFPKIIFRFTTIYFIIDTQSFFKIQILGKKVHARCFGHILNQAQVIQKNVKPSHYVILCDLVARKSNKLGLSQIF